MSVSAALRVVSWNVLAQAHFRPGRYPQVDPACFDPHWRLPRVVARARAFEADVLCLQEVDVALFALLQRALGSEGYLAAHEVRTGRPDGCALFVRAALAASHGGACGGLVRSPASADPVADVPLAQYSTLVRDGLALGLVNTHLRWDAPERVGAAHAGVRQACHLLEQLRREAGIRRWIVCGDLNAGPESEVLRTLTALPLCDAGAAAAAATFQATGAARRIDFVLHSPQLRCRALLTPPLPPERVLPDADEPSDHLPVIADFD